MNWKSGIKYTKVEVEAYKHSIHLDEAKRAKSVAQKEDHSHQSEAELQPVLPYEGHTSMQTHEQGSHAIP